MKPSIFIICIVLYKLPKYCEADWTRFATSDQYSNTQLVTNLIDFFPLKMIPKVVSVVSARIECSIACTGNTSCLAFNFYETEAFYICELLPDNFCNGRARKVLVHRDGNSVWEKLSGNMSRSCVDLTFGAGNIPCEFVQPGCLGTWPNCNECFKSCKDCFDRGYGTNYYNCTLWPVENVPIFGACFNKVTYLFKRIIDIYTGDTIEDYRMQFSDFYLLYKLQIYSQFCLYFCTSNYNWYVGSYINWAIDENGILLGNWTFVTPYWGIGIDVLNATGRPAIQIPFVQVPDDRYGCGSFWLLDNNNSTYCPVGQTGMLGPVQKDSSGYIQSTGMKLANLSPGKTFHYVTAEVG